MDIGDLHNQALQAVPDTARLIHALHQYPNVAEIPVFTYAELQPFGRYVPADGGMGHIELSIYGPHLHLTFAHEVGHWLDQVFAQYAGYASATPFSILQNVMRVIEQSYACQALKQLAVMPEGTLAERVARQRARYWSNPEELWARAYAQYIATRSADARLLAQVWLSRQLETHVAAAYVQWEDSDFASIAQEIENTFQRAGWI